VTVEQDLYWEGDRGTGFVWANEHIAKSVICRLREILGKKILIGVDMR